MSIFCVKYTVSKLAMKQIKTHNLFFLINNNDFRNNDDPIDDIRDISINNVCMRPYNYKTNNHFNSSVHNGGVGPSDIRTNDEDENQNNIPINNKDNRPIPSMVRSRRRTTYDHLVSLTPVLPLNLAASNLVRSL